MVANEGLVRDPRLPYNVENVILVVTITFEGAPTNTNMTMEKNNTGKNKWSNQILAFNLWYVTHPGRKGYNHITLPTKIKKPQQKLFG